MNIELVFTVLRREQQLLACLARHIGMAAQESVLDPGTPSGVSLSHTKITLITER